MKMKKRVSVLCIVLLHLICFVNCQIKPLTDTKALIRVFTQEEDILTDGIVTYTKLPDHWRYTGEYPLKIGRVNGGNSLYASDETGMIVKERKSVWADMEYSPWIREDIELPEIPSEDSTVIIKTKDRHSYTLYGSAREEFIRWYRCYLEETNDYSDLKLSDLQPCASITFSIDTLPNFEYSNRYWIKVDKDRVYITDADLQYCILVTFDVDTSFYKWVIEHCVSTV